MSSYIRVGGWITYWITDQWMEVMIVLQCYIVLQGIIIHSTELISVHGECIGGGCIIIGVNIIPNLILSVKGISFKNGWNKTFIKAMHYTPPLWYYPHLGVLLLEHHNRPAQIRGIFRTRSYSINSDLLWKYIS